MSGNVKPYDYNLKSIPDDIRESIKQEQIRLIETGKSSSIRMAIFSLIRRSSK